jgi:protein-disulfide isomerase
MPKSLQLAYYLIAISLALNIITFCGVFGTKGSANQTSQIAKWIYSNPEAILESVNKYAMAEQEKSQKDQQANVAANIKVYQKELEATKNHGVINPDGEKVIVEFFDYDCPYCRIAAKSTRELIEKRKDVKVITRPLVIHDSAQYATEVGIVVSILAPEKYVNYYEAIMIDAQGQSRSAVKGAVEKTGLQWSKVESELNKRKSEISAIIADSRDLAGKLGINGTPGFVLNGQLIPGAVDADTLSSVLDQPQQ